MADREPTVVEKMVSAWRASPGRHDASMLAALQLLEEALFEQFDGHAEPSDAIGILIARHQAVVDEETECNQTPPHTRDIQPDEES